MRTLTRRQPQWLTPKIKVEVKTDERRKGGDRRAGKTRVVIVDGHTLFRRGVRNILELESDIEVVGEAGSGREAIAVVEELTPDVVLMDLSLPAPERHRDDAAHQARAAAHRRDRAGAE